MIFAETPVFFQTRDRTKCKNYPNTLYSDITEDEPRVLMSYIDPKDPEKSEWCFECKELEQFLAKTTQCDGAECENCEGLGCPAPIVKNPWNRQPFDPDFLKAIAQFAKTDTYIGSLSRFESEVEPVRDSVRQLSKLDEIVTSRGVREGLSSDPYVTVSSYLNLEPKYWVRLWEHSSKDDVIATLYHNRLVKIDEIYLVNAIIRHGQMKRQLETGGAANGSNGSVGALSVEERECIASEFQVYDRIINLYFKINFHGLIMSALEEEDFGLLANLRERGATPEDARSDDQSALLWCCEYDLAEGLIVLHQVYGLGHDDAAEGWSESVFAATENGSVDALVVLHDLYKMDRENAMRHNDGGDAEELMTAPQIACELGYPEVLEIFHRLYKVTTKDIRDCDSECLRLACQNDHSDIVRQLHDLWGLGKRDLSDEIIEHAIFSDDDWILKHLRYLYQAKFNLDKLSNWRILAEAISIEQHITVFTLKTHYNLRLTPFQKKYFLNYVDPFDFEMKVLVSSMVWPQPLKRRRRLLPAKSDADSANQIGGVTTRSKKAKTDGVVAAADVAVDVVDVAVDTAVVDVVEDVDVAVDVATVD